MIKDKLILHYAFEKERGIFYYFNKRYLIISVSIALLKKSVRITQSECNAKGFFAKKKLIGIKKGFITYISRWKLIRGMRGDVSIFFFKCHRNIFQSDTCAALRLIGF